MSPHGGRGSAPRGVPPSWRLHASVRASFPLSHRATIATRAILRAFLAGAALLAAAGSADAQLQAVTTFVAPVEAGSAPAATALPQLHGFSDIALGAGSLAGIAIGLELPVTRQSVPAQGLDPSTIGWGIDRDIVGAPSSSADKASDVFLLATVLF